MPTYDFECEKCDKPFSVIRSIKEESKLEACPDCGNLGTRVFGMPIVIGAKVESAEYNPAFGQVVKNKRERDELAKRKGMIEVGNETPQTLHKIAETTQTENRKKSWSED